MGRSNMEKDVIKAFLGDETEFKGVLSFEGTVRIDGRFEGEVLTEDNLIVGDKALVKAEIKVGAILVQGVVEGNIYAAQKIQIASKGKLIGSIITPSLHIEEGAILEGNVSMLNHDEKKIRILPRKKHNNTGDGEVAAPDENNFSSNDFGAPAVKSVNFE
ncbi:MAG TPA: polymer-forming cytoskeletal protein [Nitrospirae bacterium]|nr:polymer-forming cytoskeletal protein [Nitrospirota bacterium]